MKALTVRQQWASRIIWGFKDLENRDWRLPPGIIGQCVAIHARGFF